MPQVSYVTQSNVAKLNFNNRARAHNQSKTNKMANQNQPIHLVLSYLLLENTAILPVIQFLVQLTCEGQPRIWARQLSVLVSNEAV